jgi:hypothetical protein
MSINPASDLYSLLSDGKGYIHPQDLDNIEDCMKTFKGVNLIQDISRLLKSAEESGLEVSTYVGMIPQWTKLVLSYPTWGSYSSDASALMLLDVLREQINSWTANSRRTISTSLEESRDDILSMVSELHEAVQSDESLSSGFRAYMFAVLRRVKEAAESEMEGGNFDFADAVFEMSVYVDSVLARSNKPEAKTVYERAKNFFSSEALRDWVHIAIDTISVTGQLPM